MMITEKILRTKIKQHKEIISVTVMTITTRQIRSDCHKADCVLAEFSVYWWIYSDFFLKKNKQKHWFERSYVLISGCPIGGSCVASHRRWFLRGGSLITPLSLMPRWPSTPQPSGGRIALSLGLRSRLLMAFASETSPPSAGAHHQPPLFSGSPRPLAFRIFPIPQPPAAASIQEIYSGYTQSNHTEFKDPPDEDLCIS